MKRTIHQSPFGLTGDIGDREGFFNDADAVFLKRRQRIPDDFLSPAEQISPVAPVVQRFGQRRQETVAADMGEQIPRYVSLIAVLDIGALKSGQALRVIRLCSGYSIVQLHRYTSRIPDSVCSLV